MTVYRVILSHDTKRCERLRTRKLRDIMQIQGKTPKPDFGDRKIWDQKAARSNRVAPTVRLGGFERHSKPLAGFESRREEVEQERDEGRTAAGSAV